MLFEFEWIMINSHIEHPTSIYRFHEFKAGAASASAAAVVYIIRIYAPVYTLCVLFFLFIFIFISSPWTIFGTHYTYLLCIWFLFYFSICSIAGNWSLVDTGWMIWFVFALSLSHDIGSHLGRIMCRHLHINSDCSVYIVRHNDAIDAFSNWLWTWQFEIERK